jgi:hypothetical protein
VLVLNGNTFCFVKSKLQRRRCIVRSRPLSIHVLTSTESCASVFAQELKFTCEMFKFDEFLHYMVNTTLPENISYLVLQVATPSLGN